MTPSILTGPQKAQAAAAITFVTGALAAVVAVLADGTLRTVLLVITAILNVGGTAYGVFAVENKVLAVSDTEVGYHYGSIKKDAA